jgi:hypothetical protein
VTPSVMQVLRATPRSAGWGDLHRLFHGCRAGRHNAWTDDVWAVDSSLIKCARTRTGARTRPGRLPHIDRPIWHLTPGQPVNSDPESAWDHRGLGSIIEGYDVLWRVQPLR